MAPGLRKGGMPHPKVAHIYTLSAHATGCWCFLLCTLSCLSETGIAYSLHSHFKKAMSESVCERHVFHNGAEVHEGKIYVRHKAVLKMVVSGLGRLELVRQVGEE